MSLSLGIVYAIALEKPMDSVRSHYFFLIW